ncbi:MAG: hypothetical protein OEZ06_31545 [Myxococcales bacterium]|nr:hypothetical protein [Myxococcales bacterium]
MGNGTAPVTVPPRPTAIETDDASDIEERWEQAEQAYREGRIRDEDLLLDPAYQVLMAHRPLSDLLRIRREF